MSPSDNGDVWPRFERLARSCKITVTRDGVWRVNVRTIDGGKCLESAGPDLQTAVTDALQQAERLGWDNRDAG